MADGLTFSLDGEKALLRMLDRLPLAIQTKVMAPAVRAGRSRLPAVLVAQLLVTAPAALALL